MKTRVLSVSLAAALAGSLMLAQPAAALALSLIPSTWCRTR